MSVDLEQRPDRATELCREAFERLWRTVAGLDDRAVAAPSRLPGWTVAHVLSHLARNADGHARRLQGALDGEDVGKYAGGVEQRAEEIAAGAARSAAEILADLRTAQGRLDRLMSACAAAGWPNDHFRGGSGYGVRGCPAHRLREIEMHHVDLGLGYGAESWSEEYVAWDLAVLLDTVPDRLADPRARRRLAAWLAGRGPLPSEISLLPWG